MRVLFLGITFTICMKSDFSSVFVKTLSIKSISECNDCVAPKLDKGPACEEHIEVKSCRNTISPHSCPYCTDSMYKYAYFIKNQGDTRLSIKPIEASPYLFESDNKKKELLNKWEELKNRHPVVEYLDETYPYFFIDFDDKKQIIAFFEDKNNLTDNMAYKQIYTPADNLLINYLTRLIDNIIKENKQDFEKIDLSAFFQKYLKFYIAGKPHSNMFVAIIADAMLRVSKANNAAINSQTIDPVKLYGELCEQLNSALIK